MKKILFALFVCFSITNVNGQLKIKRLLAATELLRIAMLDGDEASLTALVGDSLSYGHSSGKLEKKADFIKSLASGASDFLTLEISNQTFQHYKHSAVIRHTLQADTNDNGVAGKVKLHVMQVWIKRNNAWKLVARQAVKVS